MEAVKDRAPLVGVVMCCTSITPEARHIIANAAEEMGAVHKFDLTSDVTHLVVGHVDTPKYKYVAKERPDVKIVLPSLVEAAKQIWMEGGDVELEALEAEHRAPPLMGLKICLTGFEDPKLRENIKTLVSSNGAEFHGDLTKAVTHLICASPEGKKYEHARRWQINVIGIEWLQESIERTMVLEETLYDPILAPQDRGKEAYNKRAMQTYKESLQLGKRKRYEETVPEPAARRKLRRTMSKKMESQQETIWADIASAGSGQAKQEEWQAPELDSVLGGKAPKEDSADVTPEPTIEPTNRRSSTAMTDQTSSRSRPTFQDTLVYIHGFSADKVKLLRTVLEGNGARCYTSAIELQDETSELDDGYVIVPHDVLRKRLTPVPGPAANFKYVTEWWVESCLQNRMQEDPDTYPLCKPFDHFPIEGFEGLTISSTGFSSKGMDLLHIHRVVKLMGATYSEQLDPKVNILICNSTLPINKDKLDFAAENNIEAVNEQWLYHSVENYVREDTKEYIIKTETPTVPVDYVPTKANVGVARASVKSRMLQLEFEAPSGEVRKENAKITKTSKSINVLKTSRGPFLDDDEDDSPAPTKLRESSKRPLSQPLGELSQEQQNSQHNRLQGSRRSEPLDKEKPSQSLGLPQNENKDTISVDAADKSQAEVSQKKEQLNTAIASLLAARQNSETRRTASDPIAKPDVLGRRRRGPLGRAPSSESFGSLHAGSLGSNVSQDEARMRDRVPDPSQKIIYEDEKAAEGRRALIRKMGGLVDGEGEERTRVESIGIVRDLVGAGLAAVGSLASGRGKRKGAGKR